MPRNIGSDDDEASLPLDVLPEEPVAGLSVDAPGAVDGLAAGRSAETLPETEELPVAGLSVETLPDTDGLVAGLAVDMPPELGALPETWPLPDGAELTLGAAVDELLPPVAGDALGVLLPTAAWARRLHRSKSAWVGDAGCAWAMAPTASKLPAEIMAAICRAVIIVSSSCGLKPESPWGQRRSVQARCQ
jgi:hypothetical protein